MGRKEGGNPPILELKCLTKIYLKLLFSAPLDLLCAMIWKIKYKRGKRRGWNNTNLLIPKKRSKIKRNYWVHYCNDLLLWSSQHAHTTIHIHISNNPKLKTKKQKQNKKTRREKIRIFIYINTYIFIYIYFSNSTFTFLHRKSSWFT